MRNSQGQLCILLVALISVMGDENKGTTHASHYASVTRSMNGMLLEYTYDDGRETLRVFGEVGEMFDQTTTMDEFRELLGIKLADKSEQDVLVWEHEDPAGPSTKEHVNVFKRSILEQVSDFFVGRQFTDSVNQEIAKIELDDDLEALIDDINEIQTQERILSRRQADLGRYLRVNPPGCPVFNPTLHELASVEADRLFLLEHRLRSVKKRLLDSKSAVLEQLLGARDAPGSA